MVFSGRRALLLYTGLRYAELSCKAGLAGKIGPSHLIGSNRLWLPPVRSLARSPAQGFAQQFSSSSTVEGSRSWSHYSRIAALALGSAGAVSWGCHKAKSGGVLPQHVAPLLGIWNTAAAESDVDAEHPNAKTDVSHFPLHQWLNYQFLKLLSAPSYGKIVTIMAVSTPIIMLGGTLYALAARITIREGLWRAYSVLANAPGRNSIRMFLIPPCVPRNGRHIGAVAMVNSGQ